MTIEELIKTQIYAHAEQQAPVEACGVVILLKGRLRYIPCTNQLNSEDHFIISPTDYAKAEDLGEIMYIVHSHPKSAPKPSQTDLSSLELDTIPWIIVNPFLKEYTITNPSGYVQPLIGRTYHYGVVDCKEYARQYLHENGTKYNFEDLLTIAKGQLTLEQQAIQKAEQLFIEQSKNKIIIDTDMYVMKVWCEYVFNDCHTYILDQIHTRKYDLYLLCDIDLPWSPDEMREYPDEKPRQELFAIYKDILINQDTPWGIVSGTGNQRTQNAISIIDKNLGK